VVAPAAMLAGSAAAVTLSGSPVSVMATGPVNDPERVMVMAAVPVRPWATLKVVADRAIDSDPVFPVVGPLGEPASDPEPHAVPKITIARIADASAPCRDMLVSMR